ncbi:Protein-lysine N-methyltransferase rrg1 [Neolecta irregularis DAH-3]|uniref:Protein-lysine N-methyltransferase rrg1 n=1 Tax=Neolecta irregularis (strain DAH-3) TaxID=1198029 RepID=A0A1U7LWU6_NEOID|nr:Protein-lysine N-methyltransferase rrg1 [Neolecta irregularis DAH-3]|eukprot:OLL27147.1 Protein-lysine N-methyltransferase rrg1 [Neolecta irregularis DAH-3]
MFPRIPPNLSSCPSFQVLYNFVEDFRVSPPNFESPAQPSFLSPDSWGWLITVVSSDLAWIEDDVQKELIWESTSRRISERCGRCALPAMTRIFKIFPTLEIALHEPSWTSDNLGLKTWGASFVLSKKLDQILPSNPRHILELGSGTGLVGLTAAALRPNSPVLLTDLPEIVLNIVKNIDLNHSSHGGNAKARILNWLDKTTWGAETFDLIIASDPIYSEKHPSTLLSVVEELLETGGIFISIYPLRQAYASEIRDFETRMKKMFTIEGAGEESAFDDWDHEVQFRWSIHRKV